MENNSDRIQGEDTTVSPAKRVKLDHDFESNGDRNLASHERRKGVASIKQE